MKREGTPRDRVACARRRARGWPDASSARAVYQVGCSWSIHSKKRGASNPGGRITLAPALSEASRPPMSPCTWNSGITFRHRSDGRSARLVAMVVADTHRWLCVSATNIGARRRARRRQHERRVQSARGRLVQSVTEGVISEPKQAGGHICAHFDSNNRNTAGAGRTPGW